MPGKPRGGRFSRKRKQKFIQNSRFDKNFIKGAFLFIVLLRGKTIIRSSNENKRKYGRAGRRVCEARLVGKGKSICITQVVIMKHSHVRKTGGRRQKISLYHRQRSGSALSSVLFGQRRADERGTRTHSREGPDSGRCL